MPLYEFECEVCGFTFDRLMKMSDPKPPCPGLVGPVGAEKEFQVASLELRKVLTEAQQAFENGRKVVHEGQELGPEDPFEVVHLVRDEDGECLIPQTETLGWWVEHMVPCGGATKRLISRTEFVLKGGGWYKDGY